MGNNEWSATQPARATLPAAGAVTIDRKLRQSTRVRAEMATPIVTAAFYGVLWAVESRQPHRQQWRPVGAEVRTDAASLASVLATQAGTTAMAAPLTNRIGPNLGVGRLPLPVGVAIAVVAFDCGHTRPAPVAPLHGLRRGRQQLRSGDVGVGPGVRHLVPAHAAPWARRTRCGPHAQLP